MTDINPQDLAGRHIALWNEPDAALRRKAIQVLRAEDSAHILQPPVAIREAAAALGSDSTTRAAHGYGALEAPVTRSHERFVAPGQYTFQPRDNAICLHHVVKFNWEMVPTGGEPVGGGLEVLALDDNGPIKTDYMSPGA